MKCFLDKVIIQLRHNREAQGLSQQQLASLLKIGLRSYQRYENGESTPPIDFLFQASKVLNFEMKDLFDLSKLQFGDAYFKMYPQEEAEAFRQHKLVQESALTAIVSRASFLKVRESYQVEEMLQDEAFMSSPYAYSVCTPKQTVVNLALKEKAQLSTHVFPTHFPHRDKILLGRMWATLIDKNPYAFDHQMILPENHHSRIANGKYLFENHNFKYFVIGVVNITQSETVSFPAYYNRS